MKAILLTLLALTILGCNDYVRAPLQGRQDPYAPAQVNFASKRLRDDTAISAPTVRRDEAGLLHVTLPIRAAIDKTLYVDYSVTFFDRTGQPVSTLGPFTKTLDPLTPDMIQVNSTSPAAADFQIDLRYAR